MGHALGDGPAIGMGALAPALDRNCAQQIVQTPLGAAILVGDQLELRVHAGASRLVAFVMNSPAPRPLRPRVREPLCSRVEQRAGSYSTTGPPSLPSRPHEPARP